MKHKLIFTIVILCTQAFFPVTADATECVVEPNNGESTGTCVSASENATENDETITEPCVDSEAQCPQWAKRKGCIVNPEYMFKTCRFSCSVCKKDEPVDIEPCVDKEKRCEPWARKNQCEENPNYMIANCRKACKACPTSITSSIDFGVRQKHVEGLPVKPVIRLSKQYVRRILSDPDSASARLWCRNANELCSAWAAKGECNNSLMKTMCGPACQSCDVLDTKRQCKAGSIDRDAFANSNDMTAAFDRIVENEEFERYNPYIVYAPHSYKKPKERTGPWFMTFENFLSDLEIEKILEHGERLGYGNAEEAFMKPQVDGSFQFMTSSYKTSYNSWCDKQCEEDPVIRGFMDRVTNVTGLPFENTEPLQMARYKKGERNSLHSDYIESQSKRPCGVRVLSFFFFLNDDYSGGETYFPMLMAMKMKPKKGKAILWTNVKPHKMSEEGDHFDYEPLHVTRGEKHVASLWLHQRNFRDAFRKTCTKV